jgi:cobalt-precorrin 5A hydrolase
MVSIISFTQNGQKLGERMLALFQQPWPDIVWIAEHNHKPTAVPAWVAQRFTQRDALIFIGATGIAVRLIAPYLQGKTKDPAVLVTDDQGLHVISLLSGHLGGANELTLWLAEKIGADPVITTASDINHKIALDVWAQKNDLVISNIDQVKTVASAILAGKKVSFTCAGEIVGDIPQELQPDQAKTAYEIIVTPQKITPTKHCLWLIPQAYILGIGCKKGTTVTDISRRVTEEMDKMGLSLQSIKYAATIDIKKEEAGLLSFCEQNKIPLSFYPAHFLKSLPGAFHSSPMVLAVTGVDNVCERAAVARLQEIQTKVGYSDLLLKKSGKDGVTIAVAQIDWRVSFE